MSIPLHFYKKPPIIPLRFYKIHILPVYAIPNLCQI